jgi:hypothetical protein
MCVRAGATIQVERSNMLNSTLDMEARRLILHVPSHYSLDINLGLPDSDVARSLSSAYVDDDIRVNQLDQFLTLKRARDFDVDNAIAEWRTAEGVILVHV